MKALPTSLANMLELTSEHYIARGLHRECYVHPENPNRCVKVVVNGDQTETERELAYYQLLEKRGIAWDMLPKYHGTISTNKGPGTVFDLVRDADGATASSLESLLEKAAANSTLRTQLETALSDLRQYLLDNAIVTMTIKPKNILAQALGSSYKLFIIDNIGNSDFIPLCNYSNFFARLKMGRKWRRFEQDLKLGA